MTEINQLLDNATNNCTARSCFRVLSHLDDQEGLLKALEMLPNDTDFIWHLDTAGALARWGDSRAVDPLLLKLTLETPKARSLSSINLGNFGYEDARVRAALALGHFKDPRIEKELRKNLRKRDIGAACYVSLYRITGDAKHIDELSRNASRRKYDNLIQPISSLRTIDSQRADALYDSFVSKGLIDDIDLTIND